MRSPRVSGVALNQTVKSVVVSLRYARLRNLFCFRFLSTSLKPLTLFRV